LLVQCDAKALEWRVAVDLSADPVGVREILDKQDTHLINQGVFSLPSRLIAKRYLFRTIFRGSGYAFSKDNDFKHVSDDPAYWDDINGKFYAKYNGLDATHKRWAEKVYTGQPLVGPTGRFWKIPMGVDRLGNPKLPWTTLTNYPVQGTAADIVMLARISLRNRMLADPCGELIATVHDSIVVDTKYVDKVARMMYGAFEAVVPNLEKLFGYKANIPYECEVKIGPNLTEMEEYELV
jgi:hypothetical protein